MNACAMIARCHRHQWPAEYGQEYVPVSHGTHTDAIVRMSGMNGIFEDAHTDSLIVPLDEDIIYVDESV